MAEGEYRSKKVWVTDVAAVTALAHDLDGLWRRVMWGETSIKPVQRFPVERYTSRIAALMEDLSQSGGQSLIHALIDRLFRKIGPVPSDAFLVTATTKAGIDNLERLRHGIPADPNAVLLASIPNIVSQKLGLEGRAINISAACASSAIAVARGAALIATGRADAVLVCCLDVVTEFVFSGFSSLGALSPVPCMPFDRERKGLSLGEGAAALMLMSSERAEREGMPHLGTVSGWGIAGDAHHITAPARDGRGLIKAVGLALHSAMLKEDDISVISAHGTGTVYNDLMELTAFRHLFGHRRLPVYSVKGAIGHTMGAAGGIEVALGLKTLFEQVVPPTVGLSNPEDDAAGLVSPIAREMTGDYLLTTNSGFGGTNAAIILKRGEKM
ncbi:MAG: beta-ketoacyl-[acyl-carrier-protein] synthase family protein [Deltaproteobacteria bacterium]|nr:beta-ketoacyl-[acyl-carrier-protein] synthase family protein [Deltaproteobacteria bacterium]